MDIKNPTAKFYQATSNQPAGKRQDPLQPLLDDNSLVIGAGALLLGFVVGSGKWDWFARTATGLLTSLGGLTLEHFSQSVREHYKQRT